jgi:hypothetical protein
VKILDHEHQRRVPTEPPEQVQQQLQHAGLRSAALRGGFGSLRTVRPAQLGQQSAQFVPGDPDQRVQHLRFDRTDQPAQQLHDRSPGQGAALVQRHATADQDPSSRPDGAIGELTDQARLPHTGLAHDQHHGRLPLGRPPARRLKQGKLLRPADQHRARHPSRHADQYGLNGRCRRPPSEARLPRHGRALVLCCRPMANLPTGEGENQ